MKISPFNAKQSKQAPSPSKIIIKASPQAKASSISYAQSQQAIVISPPQGVTKVSPIRFINNARGGKSIRTRKLADELSDQALEKGQRPTTRALRMANALQLESLMETGKFANLHQLSLKARICRNSLVRHMEMLNRSNEEIEEILFETY